MNADAAMAEILIAVEIIVVSLRSFGGPFPHGVKLTLRFDAQVNRW
jgi:hypothetical protein